MTTSTPAARPRRGLIGRLRDLMALVVREALKFGVVGAVALVVDTGLFNLLLHVGASPVLDGKPLTAKVVSVSVATLVAWLGNRYWTFRRRRRSAVPKELVLFAVVNVGGLLLALVPLGVSRYVLGLESAVADNISANVIGLALGTVFRFVMYRTYVFNEGVAHPHAGDDRATVERAAGDAQPGDSRPASTSRH